MYRSLSLVLCTLLSLMLVSCSLNETTDISVPETTGEHSVQDNSQSNTVFIKLWDSFCGDITLPEDYTQLPIVDYERSDRTIRVFGMNYSIFELSNEKLETGFTSGWRLDLSKLTAVAQAGSGETILFADSQNNAMICLYDTISGQIQCYISQNFNANGSNMPGIDSFVPHIDGEVIQDEAFVEYIWNLHVSEGNYQAFLPVLDGEYMYYSLLLVHRENVALEYELNFVVCGGLLCIENLDSKQIICVPIE